MTLSPGTPATAAPNGPDTAPAGAPQSDGARLMAEANDLALLARAAIKLEIARGKMATAAHMKARNDRAEAAEAKKAAATAAPRQPVRHPRFG